MTEFWDKHYYEGGTSGPGSIDSYRDWKWKVITGMAGQIDDVIDIGCGDLSFWEGKQCKNYTGIDISKVIIDKNIKLRPVWNFIVKSADELVGELQAPVVLCLDVLFHIMDEVVYEKIFKNLGHYSSKWIFLNTWRMSPFGQVNTDGKYQTYWGYIPKIEGFNQVKWVEHPDGINVMVCLKREETQ